MLKKYAVYGIGSALVDLEFQVSDDFLKSQNLEKGMTLLIEKERRDTLLNLLKNPQKQSCGGSCANTVVTAAKLGSLGFYSCKVSQDQWGQFFAQDLKENYVDSNLIHPLPMGNTGTCTVLITPDHERTMCTYLGITNELSSQEIVEDALKESQYLFLEGYSVCQNLSHQAALTAQELCRKHGVKIAVSFSDPSIVQYFKNNFLEWLKKSVDVVFCNEQEAKLLTHSDRWQDALELLSNHAKMVVMTRGGEGSLILSQGKQWVIAPHKVTPVNLNGAGDTYAGAFLYGLSQGMEIKRAGELASFLSAQVVTQFGARLETIQIKNFLSQFQEAR